jgi:carbon monoxide dehydrogenase subunit G
MLKKILLVIAVLIVGLLAYAATRPDSMRVERQTTIQAAPDRIFTLINDFHNWKAWSPWEKMDPEMKRTYPGMQSGKGAAYQWAGNRDVGSGRMEITDVAPPSRITIDVEFNEPFQAHNVAEFTLVPQGDSTAVTWAMSGQNAYLAKLMGIFVDMDSMIGRDFETGLANLKAVVEKQ